MRKQIVWNYISEYDLKIVKDWMDSIPTEKPKLFQRMLYLIGADPNHRWEETTCQHRTRTGEIVHGRRFAFIERTDKLWLNSGFASLEAIMCEYN